MHCAYGGSNYWFGSVSIFYLNFTVIFHQKRCISTFKQQQQYQCLARTDNAFHSTGITLVYLCIVFLGLNLIRLYHNLYTIFSSFAEIVRICSISSYFCFIRSFCFVLFFFSLLIFVVAVCGVITSLGLWPLLVLNSVTLILWTDIEHVRAVGKGREEKIVKRNRFRI